MLLWLPMISRFLCFSKAYLCRGQSSPKRRWIVVASWRQLWRRPWRRRFGIVKRTLCVRVVCVCVCCNAIKSEAPWHGIRRFFFFFVSTSFSKKAQESHRAPHVLSLSFFPFFFFEFFSPMSNVQKGCRKVFLSSLSLSSLSLVLVCCRSPTTERTKNKNENNDINK